GALGVIVEVSLKVLPRPAGEVTLRFALEEAAALTQLNRWAGLPLPLSASAWNEGLLHLRLSGSGAAVNAARQTLGGEQLDEESGRRLWQQVREQTHPYFAGERALWRLSLPQAAPLLGLPD